MDVIATQKGVRISPRKIRLVADMVRKNSISQALTSLAFSRKRGAAPIHKAIKSAIANAVNNGKLKEEDLMIKRIEVQGGEALKRFHPSTRGRVHPYKKRATNITVILTERSTHGAKN